MARRHRAPMHPITEMNVTNLLDTAFVLLMAFMLVAPTVQHGLELQLPAVAAGTLASEEKTVTLVIQPPQIEGGTERVFIEDARVPLEDLGDRMAKEKAANPKVSVVLEIDKEVRYSVVAEVISQLQAAGIEGVGFATDPITDEQGKPAEAKKGKPSTSAPSSAASSGTAHAAASTGGAAPKIKKTSEPK